MGHGPIDSVSAAAMADILAQSKMPRKIKAAHLRQVVKDMAAMIRQMPLDDEETSELYKAIASRTRNRTCHKCGKLKPTQEMQRQAINGNVQNVQWICNGCA